MPSTRKNPLRSVLVPLIAMVALVGATATVQAEPILNDQTIENALEQEFLLAPHVDLSDFDLRVADGVVTLTGDVDTLVEKDRAVRLARTVKGVDSVVDRVAVVPLVSPTDGKLATWVDSALRRDPATESFEIDVAADDGVVTLTGEVDSWDERTLARRVAAGVAGVAEVRNRVTVIADPARSDAEIRSEIEESLGWDALVHAATVDVSVEDGLVRLTGTVGSAAEKSRVALHGWTAGVREVDISGLQVQDWMRQEMVRTSTPMNLPDDQIRTAVKNALRHDPRVAGFEVEPRVQSNVVTLRGTVDNLKARRAAAQDARNTVGVARVKNHLKVRPAERRTDAEVAQEIEEAFVRDASVEADEVAVSVKDGTAWLTGTVDSWYEKAQAGDVAARVRGVVEIRNLIEAMPGSRPLIHDPYVDDWYVYDLGWFEPERRYTLTGDDEIRREVESELWWSPLVDAGQVDVRVENGVVQLTGTVDSWTERRAATENAFEGGAMWVDNDLEVDASESS